MKPLLVNISASQEYQILLNVSYEPRMNSTFRDLRFLSEDETTEYPYWIQYQLPGGYAEVWVKGNLSNQNGTQIQMYYGNPNANYNMNPKQVFLLFDDFTGTEINNTIWSKTAIGGGDVTVANGLASFTGYQGEGTLESRVNYSVPYRFFASYIFPEYIVPCLQQIGLDDGRIGWEDSYGALGKDSISIHYPGTDWSTYGFYTRRNGTSVAQGNGSTVTDMDNSTSWRTLGIYADTSKVTFFVNGTSKAVHSSNIPNNTLPIQLQVRSYQNLDICRAGVTYMSVDYVFLANYTSSPEPTYSFGEARLFDGNSASVSVQNATGAVGAPVEIGQSVTIRLNYTYASNSSPVASATANLTIFDTTADRKVISTNNVLTFVPSPGFWQFNYTVPVGTNGTYKYNVRASIVGAPDSSVDMNGTFDTKDTTPPSISGAGVATSCSGYTNYRFANGRFDVSFSVTDNWGIDQNSSFCNFTMSNHTSVISQIITGNNCSFPTSGPAGASTVMIFMNDSANNTASTTIEMTAVDACPVVSQPASPPSSGGGGSGGGGSGGGGGISLAADTGLPEIIFETRALSLVQNQPEKLKIRLKNPKNEPLMVTLEGPREVSFDEKNFTLLAGGEKDVYATFSYPAAGDYKPIISAQLGDLKRMYDLSVNVAKKEADAVEQLLVDAQKAVNSLILLKGKVCGDDLDSVKGRAAAIETLAGDIRSALLLSKSPPSAAKIEELRRALSAIPDFTSKIVECKPTVIQSGDQKPKLEQKLKAGDKFTVPVIALALLFGFGLFRFLKRF